MNKQNRTLNRINKRIKDANFHEEVNLKTLSEMTQLCDLILEILNKMEGVRLNKRKRRLRNDLVYCEQRKDYLETLETILNLNK